MRKNDDIILRITGMTAEGAGVGREEGMAVFVPFSAPGELVRAHVVKVHKSYAFAKMTEVLEGADDRIEPDCPVFGRCGGCVYRHLSYEAELAVKRRRVEDALTRIGGITVPVPPVMGSERVDGYRNKAQYPVAREKGELRIGFFSPRSHRIADCRDCRLQPPEFTAAVKTVADWMERYRIPAYDEGVHQGLVRHIYLRKGEATGQIMVCLVANGRTLPHSDELVKGLREQVPGLASVVLNVNQKRTNVIVGETCLTLWGAPFIEDRLCGIRVTISPLSFYQVNRSQCEQLYQKAAEYAGLTGTQTVLDLYCGTGTIGLSMAHRAGRVIGAEVVREAVEDAKGNAAANGIHNASFLCADAAAAAAQLAAKGVRPDVVLLDPPRKGCGEGLVSIVSQMGPKRIVYVSCDPATLARDVKEFAGHGYQVGAVQPVDMFPRTAHVETVVLLSKGEIDSKKVRVEFSLEDMDMSGFQKDATYSQIKERVLQQTGLKVSSLYIAQVKQKHGIIERENYNKPKSEKSKQPKCPPEKEAAITEALKFFGMI